MAGSNQPRGLIDTDILIDHTRGLTQAATFLNARYAAGAALASVITAMELVQGCRDARQLTDIRQLLGAMIVVPVRETSAELAWSLMDTLFLSHGLRIADALIAVTALDEALPLYTKNVRHFQAIPGLVVLRPY